MSRISSRDAEGPISRKEPFRSHGSLHAVDISKDAWPSTGKLPRAYAKAFAGATYAVYSYATPILWLKDGVWYAPLEKYSMTTSHHQSKANYGAALSQQANPDEKFVHLSADEAEALAS